MAIKKFGGLMPYGDSQATALATKIGKSAGDIDAGDSTAGNGAVAMVLVDKKDLGGRRVVRLTR